MFVISKRVYGRDSKRTIFVELRLRNIYSVILSPESKDAGWAENVLQKSYSGCGF